MSTEMPVNPLPPVVIALFVAIMLIEAVLSLASQGLIGGAQGVGWRINAVQDYAFSPAVWEQVVERGDWSFDVIKRFVTYPFIHANFTHAVFGAALLLALGKFVGDVFHPLSVLAVFVVSSVVGAVVFGITVQVNLPLIGVYPAVYGMIGAFTYLMWLRLGQMGQNQYRAFQLIGFLMGIQLLFGLLFGGDKGWIADVAGFVTGLLLSPLVAPGGAAAFLRRLRKR